MSSVVGHIQIQTMMAHVNMYLLTLVAVVNWIAVPGQLGKYKAKIIGNSNRYLEYEFVFVF